MAVVIMMMVVVPMVVILTMKGGDECLNKESFTTIKVILTIRLMMSKLFDLNFYPYFDQVL